MKKAIRQEALERRDRIPHAVKAEKDARIQKLLGSIPEFSQAKRILLYASFRSEVDTHSIIKQALREAKMVVLPRVEKEKHMLLLYEIRDLRELNSGYMGIPEPFVGDEREVAIDSIDTVIIPGAAFDYSGNRLGYGAGYYDALLSGKKKNMPVIALAYEEQLEDTIPSEEHDIKVDMIVTDKRLIAVSG
jgi:5-formyltetrahydrofolate cyclo-ligase